MGTLGTKPVLAGRISMDDGGTSLRPCVRTMTTREFRSHSPFSPPSCRPQVHPQSLLRRRRRVPGRVTPHGPPTSVGAVTTDLSVGEWWNRGVDGGGP